MNNAVDVVVLVLAAGLGRRFVASGGQTHKLDAKLGDKTVLQHTLAAVSRAGLAEYVVHPRAERQTMGDSIAAGVGATAGGAAWLVLPGDMPLVQPSTLRAVADALMSQRGVGKEAQRFNAVRPAWRGKLGHPVGFLAEHLPALLALGGQTGASSVWLAGARWVMDVTDEGCVRDIDTLADLQAMQNQMLEHPH